MCFVQCLLSLNILYQIYQELLEDGFVVTKLTWKSNIYIDQDKPFILGVYIFDFALGSVLSQSKDDERLYPIFHSQ